MYILALEPAAFLALILELKAGVYLKRSEIWSNIKVDLLGLKWVGNTTRQLTTPKESPRLVADCLVSVY